MTSASELFHIRRSSLARITTNLGFDSVLDRNPYQHNHQNRRLHHQQQHRHNVDDCDPLRRYPNNVRHLLRRVPQTIISQLFDVYNDLERGSLQPNHGSSQSGICNGTGRETSSSRNYRSRFAWNERLPGAVLLARQRLLERLRGASLSGNRENSRASSATIWDELASSHEFRLVNAGDWETENLREWLTHSVSSFSELHFQTEQVSSSQHLSSTKPPGLSREDLNCLRKEVYRNAGKCDEDVMSRTAQECSVCLERFLDGDKLICLPCEHRFHSSCLDAWVQTCGDCPNCRTCITLDHRMCYQKNNMKATKQIHGRSGRPPMIYR